MLILVLLHGSRDVLSERLLAPSESNQNDYELGNERMKKTRQLIEKPIQNIQRKRKH